jgi:hypothetical protein
MSLAYPRTSRFRTGATLAMVHARRLHVRDGSTSTSSFLKAVADLDEFGGGCDVTAGTSGLAPHHRHGAALRAAPGIQPDDFEDVASQSLIGVEASQKGADREPADYVARGLDDAFLEHTTFGLGAVARGSSLAPEVWR